MKRLMVTAACAVMAAGFSAVAVAGPGDPLGGSHTGCAPADTVALKCGIGLTKGLGKFNAHVIACHVTEAQHAFQSGAQNGFSNAEANCEDGPANTSATAKFDALAGKLNLKYGCDTTAATTRRDTLSAPPPAAGSLNTLNASFFCEGTDPIDADGDPSGTVASTDAIGKCELGVAKAYRKLVATIHACHAKLAAYVLKGADPTEFVAECESGKGLGKYNAYVTKLVDAGICPQCIVDNASDLGTQAVADLDAQTNEIFPCP